MYLKKTLEDQRSHVPSHAHNLKQVESTMHTLSSSSKNSKRAYLKLRSLNSIFTWIGALGLIMTALSCDRDSSDPTGSGVSAPTDDRRALLVELRAEVMIPHLERFSERVGALRTAIADTELEEARAGWREVMRAWQLLEMFQIGPAGSSELRVGGEDLRDHIYSFPIVNPCRVEQEWLAGSFAEADWVSGAAFNVKGLDAAEHLLFKEGNETVCPSQVAIIRDGTWASFIESSAYEEARWSYLDALGADLEVRAEALLNAWRGDLGEAFVNATAPFSGQGDALNQIFAGIFYLDKFVKDLKLGGPTGIYMSCLEEVCPDQVEHIKSREGRAALLANLEGALLAFRGVSASDEEPQGFARLLAREGAAELGLELIELTERAHTQLSVSELTLSEQLTRDPEALREVHAIVRELTEVLKSQLVTTLNLSVPQEGAGDND